MLTQSPPPPSRTHTQHAQPCARTHARTPPSRVPCLQPLRRRLAATCWRTGAACPSTSSWRASTPSRQTQCATSPTASSTTSAWWSRPPVTRSTCPTITGSAAAPTSCATEHSARTGGWQKLPVGSCWAAPRSGRHVAPAGR
eukprot:365652-Chlamydomonas_euryale.AAC.17